MLDTGSTVFAYSGWLYPPTSDLLLQALVLPIGVANPSTPGQNTILARSNRAFFRAPPPIEIAPRERRSRREPEKNRHFGTLTTHFPKRNQHT